MCFDTGEQAKMGKSWSTKFSKGIPDEGIPDHCTRARENVINSQAPGKHKRPLRFFHGYKSVRYKDPRPAEIKKNTHLASSINGNRQLLTP